MCVQHVDLLKIPNWIQYIFDSLITAFNLHLAQTAMQCIDHTHLSNVLRSVLFACRCVSYGPFFNSCFFLLFRSFSDIFTCCSDVDGSCKVACESVSIRWFSRLCCFGSYSPDSAPLSYIDRHTVTFYGLASGGVWPLFAFALRINMVVKQESGVRIRSMWWRWN